MAIHLTPEANPTVQEGTLYVDSATGEFNVAGRTTPHIIPGVLYPAVAGKLLDGSTSHSGNYGTAQTDGRSYYYTDIKGSKPIKDPRIGGHFGSQRQKLKSLQKLEQETATHGQDVYSVDGREWIRATGTDLRTYNDTAGNFLGHGSGTSFFEIVGYFSDVNYANTTTTNERDIQVSVDGGSVTTNTVFNTSVVTPLSGRYVDACSFANLGLGLTLGIHTLKINIPSGEYSKFYAIELIAQDTSNRNNIQIPSQNVVSYGKKFNVSGTPHYDPFNGFTPGSSVSSYIDTDTSLGVEKWKNSSTYYRPYNGGRVVKWVDSSGVIKTSVTLMPPNAKSIADSSSLTNATAKANASVANNTFYPTFEAHTTDVNEDNLHEVAKTFHYREFGNGSANGDTGYADASMLSSTDDIAYVMDDGLTSLSAEGVNFGSSSTTDGLNGDGSGASPVYYTFIGTGVYVKSTYENYEWSGQIAQNLPYGTHIFQIGRGSSGSDTIIKLDGISLDLSNSKYGTHTEVTFYQPKRPPIPEDACVLADYMLMADFVAQSTTVVETEISKGVRVVSGSRDHFIDGTSTFAGAGIEMGSAKGFQGVYGLRSGVAQTAQLPFFGTRFLMGIEDTSVAHELTINGTSVTEDVYDCSTTTGMDLKGIPTANVATLGVNTAKITMHGSNSGYRFWGTHVDSPIHTSHHYQSFETPFLHELVGGDRNMEQTNLVCSPDGKTWDEVTRDTSYLGNIVLSANEDQAVNQDVTVIFKDRRGTEYSYRNYFNKDFAIAYDRDICLKDGWYNINLRTASKGGGTAVHGVVRVNGVTVLYSYPTDSGTSQNTGISIFLKRGDYVDVRGNWNADALYNNYEITRLK